MAYGFHAETDEGVGSNPFLFVVEEGFGIVMSSTNGTLANVLPPNVEVYNERGAASDHYGGIMTAMADGSVRWVADEVSPLLYFNASTRNGGEATNLDE